VNIIDNHLKRPVLLLFGLFFICLFSFGQKKKQTDSFDIYKASFNLPQPLPGGHYSSSISVLYVVTPKDWTNDVIVAPMFYYQAKYTLPKGFNLQASLASLFISNRITLGPFYNHKLENDNYVGLGWQVVFNYGILNHFGFNTTVTGWEQQPSVTFGHAFKKTALALRADLYWTNKLNFVEGKVVIPSPPSFINGYGLTATFEQKLYKNRALTLGLTMAYERYNIIAWPAFPVNQKRYWVPTFQVGLNL
jgi:hypothetical protein